MKSKNHGFSLIEIIIVCAISGILAAIAVPAYTRIRGRAVQASAKANLTRVYTAEAAFFAAYNTYHSHLPLIGFQLENRGSNMFPSYVTVANPVTSKDYYAIFSFKSCVNMGDIAAPVAPSSLGLAVPTYAFGGFIGSFHANARLCSIASGCGHALETYYASRNTFLIWSEGCPNGNVYSPPATACEIVQFTDVWTINESRSLVNTKVNLPCP